MLSNLSRGDFEKILNRANSYTENYNIAKSQVERSYYIRAIRLLAQDVAKTKNPYYICDFMEYVDLADNPEIMPILQNAMEATGDIVHIYEFSYLAGDLKREAVDYNRLQQLIIESKNPKLICYSAEYVPQFSRYELGYALSECGNYKWCKYWTENESLRGVGSGRWVYTASYIYKRINFRKEMQKDIIFYPEVCKVTMNNGVGISQDTITDIESYALTSNNPYLINETAENILLRYEDENVRREKVIDFELAEVATGDILHIYEYGASVPMADPVLIENAAIASNMPKYMYYVACYVPNANVEKMREAIYTTGNNRYIEKIDEHIKELEDQNQV